MAQRKFAAGIVAGQSQVTAYDQAHPGNNSKPKVRRKTASLARQSKAVQAEIERLLADPILAPVVLERCPEAHDPEVIREHAVSVMLRLSRHTEPLVAMHAAEWLKAYADQLEAQQVKSSSDRDGLLRDLRGLYAKALAPPAAEPLVETEDEGPNQ